MTHVQDWLNQRNAKIDDSGRMTIQCLCDGTAFFLVEMLRVFDKLGFREVKFDGNAVTEGIPEDKPWCNYLYEVSGLLPEHWEWMKDGDTFFININTPPEGARKFEPLTGDFRPVLQVETGTQYIDTGIIPDSEKRWVRRPDNEEWRPV